MKPPKPNPDFPLYAHNSGKWAGKVEGKIRYFGRWEDPQAALEEYKAFLARGSQPDAASKEPDQIAMTVRDACNHFLAAREKDVEGDILSNRTYLDYKRSCIKLIEFYGRDRSFATLGPQDFTAYRQRILETNNPISTGNEITRIKTMLKWLKKSGYIDDYDVGPDFRKPAAKIVRRLRREKGKKLFSAQQIRDLLNESGLHLRAMILLGINCGFGNNDCNQLPLRIAQEAVETGWMEYHRPKTEVDRRCPLWPTTRQTLAESLECRKAVSQPHAFITAFGKPFSMGNCDISKRFRIVRQHANIPSGGFYWLRHTFETIAGRCKDQVAVNYIMGHVDASMAEVYREEIDDDRLLAATETVRAWFESNPTE